MTQAERDVTTLAGTVDSTALREHMITELKDGGFLDDPAIESAFRAVLREEFVPPGTPAELPYAIHDVVRTRFAEDGTTVSSLSAPVMHAGNLRQARVEPGMRCLEIGAGGVQAAMLAHLVGADSEVVTVDIDAGVTARTLAGLDRLGLAGRVDVVTADAAEHLGRGVFDRILVTVSPWTIPGVWVDQLAPDGVLVVPLHVAPGLQRVIGFRKVDGRLVSESTVTGGFVQLQGIDRHVPASVERTGPSGKPVVFEFPRSVPADFAVSDDVLATEPVEAWSGATYRTGEDWLDLLTWIMVQPRACAMTAQDPTDRGSDRSFYPTLADGASYASLHRRGAGVDLTEVGAIGKGPQAARLTEHLAQLIHRYDTDHRGVEPLFQWWPTGTDQPAPMPNTSVLPRPHGTLTVSWGHAERH